jgi:hypothetical protein
VTEHELRVCFETVKQFIRDEKAMRRLVLKEGTDGERKAKAAKLRRCDEAMAALVVMKEELKRHVEETPEQVALIDDVPSVQRRGGY